MTLLADIARELWSLFVDDRLLAAGLLGWVLAAALALPALGLAAAGGPILFAGCALVLVASVLRGRR